MTRDLIPTPETAIKMHMVFLPGASNLEQVGTLKFNTISSARTTLILHEQLMSLHELHAKKKNLSLLYPHVLHSTFIFNSI